MPSQISKVLGTALQLASLASLSSFRNVRPLFCTTVLTNDNIAIIVPNSRFIEKAVTNWTHGDLKVGFRIPVGVAYGSEVEKVRELLLSIARERLAALKEPEPVVFFEGFGDNSLNFELGVWSAEMSSRPRRFRSDLNFAIERKLRDAGIEIPFPQRDVYIRSAPPALADGVRAKQAA
jgi:small-conductance mechanosensitive channel